MRPTSSPPALREARAHLLEHGVCPEGLLDERLARSWQRSLAAGLQPSGRLPGSEFASAADLRSTLARNHELLAHSRPVMEYLFDEVRDSGSVVILADQRGTLMHTIGDPLFLRRAERVALACGASWHETHRGTNAIGTALAEAREVEVHGGEHFLERNGFLTCAAAPIFSGTGTLLGILDISGDQQRGQSHALGLASTAARMIENRLLLAGARRRLRLHLHASAEGLGTLAEGILVLNEDGWISGANRMALRMLKIAPQALGSLQLESLFDVRLDALYAHQRRHAQEALPLRTHDGRILFAQLQAPQAEAPVAPRTVGDGAGAGAGPAPRDALAALDTGDAAWRAAADKARRIIDKGIPLLVEGESGAGKEVFARAAHQSSARRNAPFVAINCAAIPENLIEAELFGYAPGAFTGARREGSRGRLREADGGTLFLDEIGDMPLTLQARLLRVLQDREVVPLGGGQAVKVDFTLMCATHRRLRDLVAAGSFRGDLYYRINGLAVQLPALRERSDFAALTARLLEDFAPGRGVRLAPEVLGALARHPWPGNLRQVAAVLRTACAMLEEGEDCIGWDHLAGDIVEELHAPAAAPSAAAAPAAAYPQNLKALSRAAMHQALEEARGNISAAARRLGISRQTLYRRLQEEDGPSGV